MEHSCWSSRVDNVEFELPSLAKQVWIRENVKYKHPLNLRGHPGDGLNIWLDSCQ